MSSRALAASLIITIDGPAGAGKTTISKRLATLLGYRYLDTGALYRGVAFAVQEAGIDPGDDQALKVLCRDLSLALQPCDQGLCLFLNGKDITGQIRTPQISMLASAVSARPLIRDFLLDTQRAIGEQKRVVCEGRDMGTVVFPQADVKFFLDADPSIRARRRYDELKTLSPQAPSLGVVEADMAVRDCNDRTRAAAPLKPASDAIHIDSSRLSIDEVLEMMLTAIQNKLH